MSRDTALHGLAGAVVHLLEPSSEADETALLAEFLAGYGSMAGRAAFTRVGTTIHGPQLNAVLVGGTGSGRKGTAARDVAAVLRMVDPRWASACNHNGIVSGEGLLELVRDPVWARKARRVKGKTDYEQVCVDPGRTDKRCHVHEPEFARLLRAARAGSLASVLREAWDGGDLASSGRQPIRCTDPHITIVGHVTLEELRRELDLVDASNGLLNRFMWLRVGRSKLLALPEPLDETQLEGIVLELKASLLAARTGSGPRDLSARARVLWAQEYTTHLAPLTPPPGLRGALLARAAPYVLRIALIYALLDRSSMIEEVHLQAALSLWARVEKTVDGIVRYIETGVDASAVPPPMDASVGVSSS